MKGIGDQVRDYRESVALSIVSGCHIKWPFTETVVDRTARVVHAGTIDLIRGLKAQLLMKVQILIEGRG
jgi:hypothetical protein